MFLIKGILTLALILSSTLASAVEVKIDRSTLTVCKLKEVKLVRRNNEVHLICGTNEVVTLELSSFEEARYLTEIIASDRSGVTINIEPMGYGNSYEIIYSK